MFAYKPSSTLVDVKSKASATFGNQYHNPTKYRYLASPLHLIH